MMINLTLRDREYKKLEKISRTSGKSIDKVIVELIDKAPNKSKKDRIKDDPMYKMEGYDVDVPADFSLNHDRYLYNS
jgi:hypothetical protein